MDNLTVEDLGKIAFRLLEVVSYYDPAFEKTFLEASSYVKGELAQCLKG